MAEICVPVCVRHLDELAAAMKAAAAVADIVEVRADCLAGPDAASLLQHLGADQKTRPFEYSDSQKPS